LSDSNFDFYGTAHADCRPHILGEAQNAASEQIKMFLNRIGFNSNAVIWPDGESV
jgi:hypothetical protein